MKTNLVKPGERLDDLQNNGLYLIQNPSQFCFGMDAILLAHYAKVKKGAKVLDFCTGNGIIPVLMSALCKNATFTGLELQKEVAEMAMRSVQYNNLEERVKIMNGNVKEAVSMFGPASFDVITCNPPYMLGSHGLVSDDMTKAIARHEVELTLDEMICSASKVLKQKGHFYMVHRPFRLAEIMGTMLKYKIEPKRMRLCYPFIDKEPTMVLIEGVAGGNSRIEVEPPLIIYEKPGVYTQEILDIYQSEEN